MSSCAIRRWGTGTPCHKEPATAASKELSDKLKIMQAERMKQDSMWSSPSASTSTTTYTSSEHSHQSMASSSSGTNQYGSSSK
jgi:hypothetical protein